MEKGKKSHVLTEWPKTRIIPVGVKKFQIYVVFFIFNKIWSHIDEYITFIIPALVDLYMYVRLTAYPFEDAIFNEFF
jgi:hypothetical protein